ncbi:MAG: hypothetical protein WKG00_40950 [Polyangiaceae bacterium]
MHSRYPLLACFALSVPLPACSEDAASSESDVTDSRVVRIVEVLSTPVQPSGAFVELRNDDEGEVSLAGWSLRFGSSSARLATRAIDAAGRGPRAGVVPGHALALVVDRDMPDADVERLACEAPIAVSKAKLGDAHAAADDVLSTTLKLQEGRHCVAVFSVAGLAGKLAGVTEVALLEKTSKRDSARAPSASRSAASPSSATAKRPTPSSPRRSAPPPGDATSGAPIRRASRTRMPGRRSRRVSPRRGAWATRSWPCAARLPASPAPRRRHCWTRPRPWRPASSRTTRSSSRSTRWRWRRSARRWAPSTRSTTAM